MLLTLMKHNLMNYNKFSMTIPKVLITNSLLTWLKCNMRGLDPLNLYLMCLGGAWDSNISDNKLINPTSL